MHVSLRTLVLGGFLSLVLASSLQGVLAITNTVRSAQQVTALEQHGLVPAVGLNILSQNLDQERALVNEDSAQLKPDERRAVLDELAALDTSISTSAPRVLAPSSLPHWHTAWASYLALRARFLRALPRHTLAPPAVRLWDRLDRALDVVKSDAGAQLYAGERLYSGAVEQDWQSIRVALISFVVMLVLGTALAFLIIRRLAYGLGNLAVAARLIAQGDLGVRMKERGSDEIATLASAFNHMIDALLSAERRADSDALTGLLNHRAFHASLATEIEQTQATGQQLCVLMIDMNDFKLFNDTYGHQVGDRVLTTFAEVLRAECRLDDRIARYGGDEFAVLAVNTDLDGGEALAERILQTCARTEIRVRADGRPLPMALSIGVASFPKEADAPAVLLELADKRMYESKRGGRLGQPFQSVTALSMRVL